MTSLKSGELNLRMSSGSIRFPFLSQRFGSPREFSNRISAAAGCEQAGDQPPTKKLTRDGCDCSAAGGSGCGDQDFCDPNGPKPNSSMSEIAEAPILVTVHEGEPLNLDQCVFGETQADSANRSRALCGASCDFSMTGDVDRADSVLLNRKGRVYKSLGGESLTSSLGKTLHDRF